MCKVRDDQNGNGKNCLARIDADRTRRRVGSELPLVLRCMLSKQLTQLNRSLLQHKTSHFLSRTSTLTRAPLLSFPPLSVSSSLSLLPSRNMSTSTHSQGQAAQKDILSWANNKDGAFKRLPSVFRNHIEKGGAHPPEKGRYTLYVCYACPCEYLAPLLSHSIESRTSSSPRATRADASRPHLCRGSPRLDCAPTQGS